MKRFESPRVYIYMDIVEYLQAFCILHYSAIRYKAPPILPSSFKLHSLAMFIFFFFTFIKPTKISIAVDVEQSIRNFVRTLRSIFSTLVKQNSWSV